MKIHSLTSNQHDVVPNHQFSGSVVSNSLQAHGLQHARLPCPSPTPWAYSNSCPSSWWCHPTISSSVVPFSRLQFFPASGSFPKSQFCASGGQSMGVSASASVFPMNIQDWFPLGWTGWNSLQSKGLSRVFSNTIVQRHQFFDTQLSLSGEGNGNPLQYSCLENFTDWGAGRLQSMGSQRVGPDWVTPLTWALFIVQLSHDSWKNHSFD